MPYTLTVLGAVAVTVTSVHPLTVELPVSVDALPFVNVSAPVESVKPMIAPTPGDTPSVMQRTRA
jgi:hypothetical protein